MDNNKKLFESIKQNFHALKELQNQLINQIPQDDENTQKFLSETMTNFDEMMLNKDFNGLNNLLQKVKNHASYDNR
jgi:hypothetical protein